MSPMTEKMPRFDALARLVPVDLRDCWKNEATDFTRWLAREENTQLLGDTIGLELELESRETPVGPFQADLLYKSTADDSWVLVENQLERTDHSHLGQLLTYAAGLQAVTIVWIARRVREQHRATLDWLNEVTDRRINFFGLEIELWRIGDSAVAPKFNVVSQPNDWLDPLPPKLSEIQRLRLEFWHAFCDHVAEEGARFSTRKPHSESWMEMAVGAAGFRIRAITSTWDSRDGNYDSGELRAEFVVKRHDANDLYAPLHARAAEIQEELGEDLTWDNPQDTKTWRAYLRKTADIQDRSSWPDQHEWLRSRLDRLSEVFGPMVKGL